MTSCKNQPHFLYLLFFFCRFFVDYFISFVSLFLSIFFFFLSFVSFIFLKIHDDPAGSKNFLDVIQNKFKALTDEIRDLRQEIVNLKIGPQTLPYGCPPWVFRRLPKPMQEICSYGDEDIPNLLFSTFMIREVVKANKKSFNAVVERLPESDKTIAKSDEDFKFVSDLCISANISKPEECWRQYSKNPDRVRPLKVRFTAVSDRDAFLKSFRKFCPIARGQPTISARRDMTVPELQLLYKLRERCRIENEMSGCFKFFVCDLSVVELARPQQLYRKPEATKSHDDRAM